LASGGGAETAASWCSSPAAAQVAHRMNTSFDIEAAAALSEAYGCQFQGRCFWASGWASHPRRDELFQAFAKPSKSPLAPRARREGSAYIAFFASNDYVPGLLGLWRSLLLVGSRFPLVVLVGKRVSTSLLRFLKALMRDSAYRPRFVLVGDRIARLDPDIRSLIDSIADMELCGRFPTLIEKLLVWGLDTFRRLHLLDTDTMVMRNIDHGLLTFSTPAAVMDYWGGRILMNSGSVVLQPDRNFLRVALAFVRDLMPRALLCREQDQGVINLLVAALSSRPWTANSSRTMAKRYNFWADDGFAEQLEVGGLLRSGQVGSWTPAEDRYRQAVRYSYVSSGGAPVASLADVPWFTLPSPPRPGLWHPAELHRRLDPRVVLVVHFSCKPWRLCSEQTVFGPWAPETHVLYAAWYVLFADLAEKLLNRTREEEDPLLLRWLDQLCDVHCPPDVWTEARDWLGCTVCEEWRSGREPTVPRVLLIHMVSLHADNKLPWPDV